MQQCLSVPAIYRMKMMISRRETFQFSILEQCCPFISWFQPKRCILSHCFKMAYLLPLHAQW